MSRPEFRIGTSGYSFDDWVGTFYPAETSKSRMFEHYVQMFATVELNYTYYRMPSARTLDSLAHKSPEGFDFWVKANRRLTHEGDCSVADEFIYNLQPLQQTAKLAGVLLQFPQSFHRSFANLRYLARVTRAMSAVPLAVEFRHASWNRPDTIAGLRERNIALACPDVPDIDALYRLSQPVVTGDVGYVRLHSRDAGKWYAGAAERYDYDYSADEIRQTLKDWSAVDVPGGKVYVYFNNCHTGKAARNALQAMKIRDSL